MLFVQFFDKPEELRQNVQIDFVQWQITHKGECKLYTKKKVATHCG